MKQKFLAISLALTLAIATGCAQRNMQAAEQTQAPASVQAQSAPPGVIPQGTQVVIRTDENITAQNADQNSSYSATVASDIIGSNGQVLVPKGSPASLAVFKNSGGTMGTDQLVLGLRSVTISGRQYAVSSGTVTREGNQGIGANQRTATHVGGGALLGTVLGAVVGGAKGAVTGAVIGAAGGAATQVLTKGDKINVPAETVLTFQLDNPITLEGYQGAR